MSKINYTIPEQNFEIISRKVGEILFVELPVQYSTNPPKIWLNRIVPFDKTELPSINIIYAGSRYPTKDRESRDSNDSIIIDVYQKGVSNITSRGDSLALTALSKLLGKIAYILESTEYETLDIPQPLIRRTQVENINILEPSKTGDGNNVMTGRITFRVDAIESSILQQPIAAEGYSTTVKLHETDKGYTFIIEN